jgi:AraC-like DNA-binding protein
VASPQHNELAVGVILRVLRHLLGDLHRPVEAHLPHEPLASPAEYLESYGCRTQFDQLATGLTIRTVDLSRPLRSDSHAHRDVVEYLETIVGDEAATLASVRTLVGRLLPSGRVTLEFVARQMNLHSKTLQRRLAAEGATFAGVVDTIRRDTAQRLLRDTRITMAHLARELGYSEQTVLTRSCHRWFGEGPAAYRRRLRDSDLAALSYRADNLS